MNRRGQIAVGFLVIAAFTLLLVRMTINLGQMSQVRTETSNAADAGALAAASWIASGENEAALIAGRMLELLGMVQAIYIVPFCPGEEARAYANQLWASLYGTPTLFGLATGPVQYLHDVADAAMFGAWNIGRREYFTAAVNNMMIRYNTGSDGYESDLGFGVTVYRDVPEKIRETQDKLYGETSVAQADLAWNNGAPFLDPDTGLANPEFIEHKASFHTDNFPNLPPRLEMANWEARYYQYKPKQTIEPFFDCDFVGVGITDTSATGPVVDMAHDGITLPDNPLAVDAAGLYKGMKGWEKIQFHYGIPQLYPHATYADMNVSVDVCAENTCGIEPQQTSPAPVRPLEISSGANEFTVKVSHKVVTSDGMVGGGVFGAIPTWKPIFREVESTAKAEYTAASPFPPPNPNDPNDPRYSRARLTDAR